MTLKENLFSISANCRAAVAILKEQEVALENAQHNIKRFLWKGNVMIVTPSQAKHLQKELDDLISCSDLGERYQHIRALERKQGQTMKEISAKPDLIFNGDLFTPPQQPGTVYYSTGVDWTPMGIVNQPIQMTLATTAYQPNQSEQEATQISGEGYQRVHDETDD